MKTHDVAKQLELTARLLRQLPDVELDAKSARTLEKLMAGYTEISKAEPRKSSVLPKGIEDELSAMSPAEVEARLSSDDEAFTVANLTELAERLGLTTSKRQSKNALVNMITRHFEAGKMQSILRGAGAGDA